MDHKTPWRPSGGGKKKTFILNLCRKKYIFNWV